MTPVRRDDEKYTADGESEPRDDRPRSREFELRDLCGGQPDAREQNEQEADFGQASAAADISLRLSLQRPRMPRGRCRVWLSNSRSCGSRAKPYDRRSRNNARSTGGTACRTWESRTS